MSADGGLTRRDLLLAAAVGLSYAALRPAGILRSAGSPAQRLAAVFPSRTSAKAIGDVYLRQLGPAADARILVARIGATVPGGLSTLVSASAGELRGMLQRAVEEDFAHSRTVVVDGWVLSATEADLCAVAVLG